MYQSHLFIPTKVQDKYTKSLSERILHGKVFSMSLCSLVTLWNKIKKQCDWRLNIRWSARHWLGQRELHQTAGDGEAIAGIPPLILMCI